ncbi:MAG: tRNA (adenosine(37)-N6)-threonylcarbamoyltransferase complex transferase subunit TsaD [Alphaproteobacteria bacterium]|nr:tRNA (adenosine(37)-N6)-threonylcarbamoyltransferase complex transferase subunit TsaD [Alphaproteobacteria bacterium]
MIVLGIESSCDDSAAAIVTNKREILSNIILSQHKEHALYKGVVPEIASRAHLNYVEEAIRLCLKEANLKLSDISCIAATTGPGLIGGLIVGTMFGKAIAAASKKPFIEVNHLEAHALTARLSNNVEFPYLLLLLSGGHCQFLVAKGVGNCELLSQTRDDAAGEAFDKVAKMLGLHYPGGPIIETLAKEGDSNRFLLPMPMCGKGELDLSFAGLKTAVRVIINGTSSISDQFIRDMCASFQHTILKILSYKMVQAIELYQKKAQNKKIIISGGVAANQYLISNLQNLARQKGYELIAPPPQLCTDNAAMVAWTGVEKYTLGRQSSLNTCPKARWSIY